MRLYQHSARCPTVLRSFLACNPGYECFIPQRSGEALAENARHFRSTTDEDPTVVALLATAGVEDERVARYLDLVPAPPTSYAFSYRQIQKQCAFFERLLTTSIQQLPYHAFDLYQMAIVAVRE